MDDDDDFCNKECNKKCSTTQVLKQNLIARLKDYDNLLNEIIRNRLTECNPSHGTNIKGYKFDGRNLKPCFKCKRFSDFGFGGYYYTQNPWSDVRYCRNCMLIFLNRK